MVRERARPVATGFEDATSLPLVVVVVEVVGGSFPTETEEDNLLCILRGAIGGRLSKEVDGLSLALLLVLAVRELERVLFLETVVPAGGFHVETSFPFCETEELLLLEE